MSSKLGVDNGREERYEAAKMTEFGKRRETEKQRSSGYGSICVGSSLNFRMALVFFFAILAGPEEERLVFVLIVMCRFACRL